MRRVYPEDTHSIERQQRVLRGLSNALAMVAFASMLNGSTPTGAVAISPVDRYTGLAVVETKSPSTGASQSTTPQETAATPTPQPTNPNASCRPGVPVSVDWPVMDIEGAKIELFGLDPKTGGLAKTESPKTFGVYKDGPLVGSSQGNVLTGGERYHEAGKSVFPPDYQQRLASQAIGSVITFHMEDGGTCQYKIDMTLPAVGKFRKVNYDGVRMTEYAKAVKQYGLYRTDGLPGIEVEGCTGPFNPEEGTSDDTGIAEGHLMTEKDVA